MFRIIGQYEIHREGDLVVVWSSSEFNLEAAHQYALDMMEMIEEMPAKFGTLVAFDSPPIIAPEVEDAMRLSARKRGERGMVAVAMATQNLDGFNVASGQWGRIYDGSGIALRFFSDVEPAKLWLQEQVDLSRQ